MKRLLFICTMTVSIFAIAHTGGGDIGSSQFQCKESLETQGQMKGTFRVNGRKYLLQEICGVDTQTSKKEATEFQDFWSTMSFSERRQTLNDCTKTISDEFLSEVPDTTADLTAEQKQQLQNLFQKLGLNQTQVRKLSRDLKSLKKNVAAELLSDTNRDFQMENTATKTLSSEVGGKNPFAKSVLEALVSRLEPVSAKEILQYKIPAENLVTIGDKQYTQFEFDSYSLVMDGSDSVLVRNGVRTKLPLIIKALQKAGFDPAQVKVSGLFGGGISASPTLDDYIETSLPSTFFMPVMYLVGDTPQLTVIEITHKDGSIIEQKRHQAQLGADNVVQSVQVFMNGKISYTRAYSVNCALVKDP
jgi:hypothetical protein